MRTGNRSPAGPGMLRSVICATGTTSSAGAGRAASMRRAVAASSTVVPRAGNDAAAASAIFLACSVNAMGPSSRFPDASCGGAAVDGEFASGEITGRIGGEERDEFRDLRWGSPPAERCRRVAARFVTAMAGHGRVDRAGAHRVDPDPVDAEFYGCGAREPPQAPLRGTVGRVPGNTLHPRL